jgi:deoxyribonuclease IV
MLLGAHMSISGGVSTSFDRAEKVGCNCMQIFTKNNNQWRAAPLTQEEVARYFKRQGETGVAPVVAHACYLLNLATADEILWQKSVDALVIELERCDTLAIPYLVIHPGSHMGAGEEAGIARVVLALDAAHARLPQARVKIALELTAGQGTNLGRRYEDLAAMIAGVREPERLVTCFDTAHALAAGYDFRTPAGFEAVFNEFEQRIGLERLVAFHLNDSTTDAGSHRDRHAHIGEGYVRDGFRLILNDPRFRNIPMILETPKSEDMHEDIENLARLRQMITP